MAKKGQEVVENVEIKDVYFDFDAVEQICFNRGVRKTNKGMAAEIGYTGVGFDKLKTKAPKVVAALYHFLKDNHLNLGDLIKECDSRK